MGRQDALIRDGRCMRCGAPPSEVHHIKPRGAGGDDSLQHLISLCAQCHADVHSGKVKASELRAVLAEEYGYVYGAFV